MKTGNRRSAQGPPFATIAEGLAAARAVFTAGDSAGATDLWRRLIEQAPNEPALFIEIGALLRDAGQFDLADGFYQEGMARCPDDAQLAIGYAWSAHQRRDFDAAQRRWAELRARFPAEPYGLTGASVSARDAGDLDRAEQIVQAALRLFPDADSTAIEYARIASARGDLEEAIARWATVRERFPAHPVGYTEATLALRAAGRDADADALIEGYIYLAAADPNDALGRASEAHDAGAWGIAAERWSRIRVRWPDQEIAYTRGARCLMELDRLDEAEALLGDCVRRFPNSAEGLALHGWVAQRREQWVEAAARYEALRHTCPDDWFGYFGGAQVLVAQNLVSVAEALLEMGMRRLPDNEMLALDHARLPMAIQVAERRNPAEAIRRTTVLRQRFPTFSQAWIRGIETLILAARLPDADALATEALARFPEDLPIALLHASIARDQGRATDALARYRRAIERFGNRPESLAGFASALIDANRTEEADQTLAAALRDTPHARGLLLEYARSAGKREDWAETLRRLEAAQEKLPADAEIQRRVYETRMRLAETGEQDGADRAGGGTGDSDRELILQFESLGGSGHGCEFGLVQRAYGAEPLSLLRWSDIQFECLLAALETQFDGVGEEENTEVFLYDTDGQPEYWTRDKRHGMVMRCFVRPNQMPHEQMLAQSARRLRFLAREQAADLTEGAKIFVYRNMWRDLTDDELRSLRRAVASYGDNTLLYVRFADQDHPHGTVISPEPGLLIGYIEHFGFSPEDRQLPSAVTLWMDVCRAAHAIWPGPA